MKNLILERQKHNEFEFDELYRMLADLKDFLDEDANSDDKKWSKNLSTIIDFQDSDGSFKLLDSYDIPSDARVDFCWMPTYICTAILMKAYMTNPSVFTLREKSALLNGLKASCARNLRGHGYEAFKGQIQALNIFMNAGLREFLDFYNDLCMEFSEMIENIVSGFEKRESRGDFTGSWGESYKAEIKSINEYFSHRNVFVYGTLMSGETNHHFLENSTFLGKAVAEGYDMYNVGWYPAIVEGDGLAIGELYQVPVGDLSSIDGLEGEGSLYAKKCERVTLEGKTTFAFIYVYLRDVETLERIPAWKDDYVWYVSYGSNMHKERFMKYIKGGTLGRRVYPACKDPTPPLAVKAIDIGHDMYFGNTSGTWKGGVSFLDTANKGNALGVAYLITKEQLDHVAYEENNERDPEPGKGWYEDFVVLGTMDGFEKITLTNENIRPYNHPTERYMNTLRMGIRENWQDMTDEEIDEYLNNCKR